MLTENHTATRVTPGASMEVPVAPRIATCEPKAQAAIREAYAQAYSWAAAAQRWLAKVAADRQRRQRWNGSDARRLFGPFRIPRVRRVMRVFAALVRRFRDGYRIRGRRVAPTIACFSTSYHRCGKGLLGNASIFGTIRLCPQLLSRTVPEIAAIVLHEMMHQSLGVGDRTHEDCEGSKHRCYRGGALALVGAGRHDLAVRNIDNYVAFAQRVAGAR